MRFDTILIRLRPLSKFDFKTKVVKELVKKPGMSKAVEMDVEKKIYDDYDFIDWQDTTQALPTLQECEAEWAIIESELELRKVRKERAGKYPPVGDSLDALWHAMDDGVLPVVEPFYSDCKAVKDAIPLP